MSKRIALGTIKFAQGQTPDVNNTMHALNNNNVLTNVLLEGSVITFTLTDEEAIDYSPVDWIKGKLLSMNAEVAIVVEEYEHVKIGYEFSNIQDDN